MENAFSMSSLQMRFLNQRCQECFGRRTAYRPTRQAMKTASSDEELAFRQKEREVQAYNRLFGRCKYENGWIGMGWNGMGWDWDGMGWNGMGWMDWIGLDWVGLDQ